MEDLNIWAAKAAITELLARYALTVDSGDAAGFAALFTENAVWEWPAVNLAYRGRKSIEALAAAIEANIPGAYHMQTHPVIDVSGDSARSVCQFVAYLSRPEQIYTLMTGRYKDELVLQNGRWLIDKRQVEVANPEIISQGKIGEYYKPLMANLPPGETPETA